VKIFITGVARSGTTLLARLMNAFEQVYVISEEISLEDFAAYDMEGLTKFDNKKTVIVGKRSENTIFSHRISKQEKEKQLKIIEDNNIQTLNIVRNGFDVVDSQYLKWGVNDPLEWIECINDSIKHSVKSIRYEELIAKPGRVQASIKKIFKLRKEHSFSSYPVFVPENCFQSPDKEYNLRKLKESKHSRRVFMKCLGLDKYHFIFYNYKLGYIY